MTIHVRINGRDYTVPDTASVLEAVRQAGVDLPTLCHDDRLTPSGACRTCLVEVSGSSRWVPACAVRVRSGMDIRTSSDALDAYRRAVLTLLAGRYPVDAPNDSPDKPFHRLLHQYGMTPAGIGAVHPRVDHSHPFIALDMAKCVDCYRCVRICDQLQGQGVWGLRQRGSEIAVVADGATFRESSCVSCGACVDTCPTGAIEDAAASRLGRATSWTRTVCPFCGTGCELVAGSRDGRLVSMKPALDAPVNKGHLCAKGRYGFEFVHAPDRVTTPMIRRDGAWRQVSWEEAVRFTADRLRDIIARHGPDSIGVLGSARATNEENYVAQKFARLVVGTNNVDCCARVCHAPSAAGLKQMLGAGMATNSFDDLERAHTILLWGANSTESHPVIGARIKQASRRGAHLIVVDPRRTELADEADLHLAIQPGTDVILANAMAHCIIDEGLCDREFVAARTTCLGEFASFVAAWDPERAARLCGVAAETIRGAARAYATGGPAICFHGLGMTEHVQGTDGVIALTNLALLTGNLGKAGCGINPLRGQNNVQGAAHVGCDPGVLPGSTPLEQGRDLFERAWHAPLPRVPGRHLLAMLDGAETGDVKALWVIGYDVWLTNPDATRTARALGQLDLVVVQDLFLTATTREFGTVFFPACSSFEKDGTFMNAERRIQRVRQAIAPVEGSRSDWQIVCAVAAAMGRAEGFRFESAEQIWDELRAICPGARGMSYGRLDRAGLQWPCPDEAHPGTPTLHVGAFAGGNRAALHPVEPREGPEQVTPDYPFVLITGRTLYQFNAGTMTSRSGLATLRPADALDVSAEDATRLGMSDGDRVRVSSRYGDTTLPVHISAAVAAGQVFATFHTTDGFVNLVTGPHRDTITATPAYKMTAVQLERVARSA